MIGDCSAADAVSVEAAAAVNDHSTGNLLDLLDSVQNGRNKNKCM